MDIDVARDLGKKLQGRVQGKKDFAKACELLANAPEGDVIILDFKSVETITGSWLNSMVVPLFSWCCGAENDFFPLFCNVRQEWLDEFRLIAEWNNQCYLILEESNGVIEKAELVGSLESSQEKSFEAVQQGGEVTGAKLSDKMPNEGIGATAWNNRLKVLFEKRLVRREKRGREQVYFPLIKEKFENGRQLFETTGKELQETKRFGDARNTYPSAL